MSFLFGQGLVSDFLSSIDPATTREAMLLTALEIAYRALEKIKCRPNETHEYDWDAYNALKDIEHSAVMPWVDKQGPFLETLNIAHKNAHALGQVISLGHENCEGM